VEDEETKKKKIGPAQERGKSNTKLTKSMNQIDFMMIGQILVYIKKIKIK
jgi:hypothetical protein